MYNIPKDLPGGDNVIKVTIDGKEYTFDREMTILEAAKQVGIHIPTLCYHPSVESIGACRICVVEIEGSPKLHPACVTKIKDGMVVHTSTPRVERARKVNTELLLSVHPNDCMTCDANGHCALQDLAYRYQIKEPRWGIRLRNLPIDDSHPLIMRDLNKCIQCQLCVRVCDEVQNMSVYSMVERGYHSLPQPDFTDKLGESSCVSCGACATICPVGAIVEKPSIGKARWWEVKKVKTTCPYCGVGCQLDVYYDPRKNEIVRIYASEEDPEINDGVLTCVKGKFGYEFVTSEDRLRKPLIKKNGKFVEATWEEALDYAADGILRIKEKYGPDAIGVISSAKCTNEENYLMQKLARAVIGTNNVDHCARLCHASTISGLAQTLGSAAMSNNLMDILKAEVIFIIGANPTENHPVYGARIKRAVRKHGAKLIVADPRRTELAKMAHIHLQQRPGTDVVLLSAMIKVILDEKLYKEDFIKERTIGFEQLVESLKDFDLDEAARITNVPKEKIVEAARLYGKAERAAILYAMGITQHSNGTQNVIALADLAMITGNFGKEGTGVNPLRGQNNVQGACDMGALPHVYPGYQRVDNEEVRKKFEEFWGVKLPEKPGLALTDMFLSPDKIKALIMMGENPAVSDPDVQHVEEFLKNLEFFVAFDIFMNESNQYADVLLPAASAFEKDGTFTNTERRIIRVRKVLEPIGDSRPDWWIIKELSKRLGYEMEYSHPSEIMEEIRKITPIYAGVTYERIEKKGLQWPVRSLDHPGTPILHTNGFNFPDGKGRIKPIDYSLPKEVEMPTEEYPLMMTTGRMLYHFHTGTMTRRVKGINEIVGKAYVEISPQDAERLGIKNGDIVRVSSRRGSVLTYAVVTDKMQPGVVFMPFHFAEARANLLTGEILDPESRIPAYKVSAVRVEKVEGVKEIEPPEYVKKVMQKS